MPTRYMQVGSERMRSTGVRERALGAECGQIGHDPERAGCIVTSLALSNDDVP